jgi:hypothetical protein
MPYKSPEGSVLPTFQSVTVIPWRYSIHKQRFGKDCLQRYICERNTIVLIVLVRMEQNIVFVKQLP